MRNVLALVMIIAMIGCSDNPVQEEATDFDFSQLEPLLNSDIAREFISKPWDVDLNGEVDLNDLVLLTTYHSPASAPNIPPVSGPLKGGTKLSNGLYELEVIGYFYNSGDRRNRIEILITNIGDDRGMIPHISEANFIFGVEGRNTLSGRNWLGPIPLGRTLAFEIHEILPFATKDISRPRRGLFPIEEVTFQATSDMVFVSADGIASAGWGGGGGNSFSGSSVYSSSNVAGIPTGTTIGAPIVFTVEQNE